MKVFIGWRMAKAIGPDHKINLATSWQIVNDKAVSRIL